ncbi:MULTISPECIES: arginase family protein [Virgibacillus]|uniref:Proclavaminate amidinohydrolase n=1 Tax=Virgibacillus massiliensis TaxID=1462526 RepID=A0A024QG77_9BACI|nr:MULTISPECIES: arginase family protein [Virgibacillus]EQB34758.1 hypothetical protein M948_20430 [Virgibacillus sp. CM-4]MYL43605.1 hypothetical protein [Virgibacillus massiliensis]CDQ41543.1 Proclavaminate amidinohydrolase [Virgibacillus massiliensis]
MKLSHDFTIEGRIITNSTFGNSLELSNDLIQFILESQDKGLEQAMSNWRLNIDDDIIKILLDNGFILKGESIYETIDPLHTTVNYNRTFFSVSNGNLYFDVDSSSNDSIEDIYGFIGVPYNRGSLVYNIDIDSPDYLREKSNDILDITVNSEGKTSGFYSTVQEEYVFQNCIIRDYGDVVQQNSVNSYFKSLTQIASKVANSNIKPIYIGGDHAVTYPIVKGINSVGFPFQVVHLDAHSDTSPPSNGIIHHSNIISLISNLENVKSIYQLGLSGFLTSDELSYANQNEKIKAYIKRDINEVEINPNLPVYLTIDVDVFDSSVIPSVSYPNYYGWNSDDFIRFLKDHVSKLNIIGIDIVEYDKSKDPYGSSAIYINNIILEILANI